MTLASLAEKTMALMTPKMATSSQKMIEMRFLVRIRGALTPPPRMDVPVMKMPLDDYVVSIGVDMFRRGGKYHAAPMTDRPMSKPTPRRPHE